MNASLKWLKAFLVLEVKKLGSPIALIFRIYVNYLDFLFLDLDESTTVLSALLLLPLTTSLLPALKALKTTFLDDLVVFNIEVSGAAILLKSRMKC